MQKTIKNSLNKQDVHNRMYHDLKLIVPFQGEERRKEEGGEREGKGEGRPKRGGRRGGEKEKGEKRGEGGERNGRKIQNNIVTK